MPHATDIAAATEPNMDHEMPDAPDPNTDSQDAVKEEKTVPIKDEALENMFDDDDDEGEDEDEYSSSAKTKREPSPQAASHNISSKSSDPEVLRAFYQRLFPFRYHFQWLNHSPTPSTDFSNREFAFVLPNDAYMRYQSFMSADQFKKQCLQLTPVRFEIGPVYSTNPRDRKSLRKASAFRPIAKELVFDIDMTDYDDIRTCCQKANICAKCWTFITMAIKVIDAALRQDFGFKHLLWVYSGRRGAHCWVSDKRARQLDDQKRRALANYFELPRGGPKGGKKLNLRRPLHPHFERSLHLLNPYFQSSVLLEQDSLATSQSAAQLLSHIPDKSLVTALEKKWSSATDRPSAQKWSDIDSLASAGNLSTLTPKQLVDVKQDIRLEYTYPRLDAEVSKKLNHLLKSPFVIHPGTGRVCVPIDMTRVDKFDPFAVPTVHDLLREIDEWRPDRNDATPTVKTEDDSIDPDGAGDQSANGRVQDWQKTSLKPYIEYFRRFVDGLLKDEINDKKREREGGQDMDF